MASDSDAKKTSLADLPEEILLHICSELDFRSLLRLGETCKTFKYISRDESLWKQQCHTEYLVKEKDAEVDTWIDQFLWYHMRIGRYHCPSIYRTMRLLWNRMEKYLEDNDPKMLNSLRGPCDIVEILIAEERMKCRFPPDLRCSLLIHNGQQITNGGGLFGCMSMASFFITEGLLDAASMARHYEPIWGSLPGCVPITFCTGPYTGQHIGVDDFAGYTVGEVFYPITNEYSRSSDVDMFITASSFREWFATLVLKLEKQLYPRIDDKIYRFEHEEGCQCRTSNCFTVKVSTCFMPEISTVNPPNFLHVYRITMSMDEDADPKLSCQLESRHWIITDMDGQEDMVDGDGVVGEYPIMRPGATFSWVSCTTFPTTYGSMSGSFTMRNLDTGEKMEITCPVFHMMCLPYKLSSERKRLMMERKKTL